MFEAEASRLVGCPYAYRRHRRPHSADPVADPERHRDRPARRHAACAQARSTSNSRSGALLRGDWHADELRLVRPELNLGLDRNGRIDWPSAAIGFDPDALSIRRLTVQDGRANLVDAASGARPMLDKLWFRGDLRSLVGPFKGEGGFIAGGERYGYRVTAGRFGDDGVKLRFALDPSDRPLAVEADGMLALDRGAPRFEGSV